MDKEILEILKSLKADVTGLKADMNDMKADMNDVKADMNDMKKTLDKHGVMLEELNKKVDTVAEVQISFSESMQRDKEKEDKKLDDRLTLIEQVVTETSVVVKDIQKDLSRVEFATANNWADIAKLKAVK